MRTRKMRFLVRTRKEMKSVLEREFDIKRASRSRERWRQIHPQFRTGWNAPDEEEQMRSGYGEIKEKYIITPRHRRLCARVREPEQPNIWNDLH